MSSNADRQREPAEAESGRAKRLSLRQRVLRVSRIEGKHHYVVFGRRSKLLTSASRYLQVRDLEHELGELRNRNRGRNSKERDRRSMPSGGEQYYFLPHAVPKPPIAELVAALAEYDVVSFDVFDTILHRTVAYPSDVFRILGEQLGFDDYSRVRRHSESKARFMKVA